MKVTACPTSSGPAGARDLASLRSLPAVTLVLNVAVLLAVIGSAGVPVAATLPDGVSVEPEPAAICPVNTRVSDAPLASAGTVHEYVDAASVQPAGGVMPVNPAGTGTLSVWLPEASGPLFCTVNV